MTTFAEKSVMNKHDCFVHLLVLFSLFFVCLLRQLIQVSSFPHYSPILGFPKECSHLCLL